MLLASRLLGKSDTRQNSRVEEDFASRRCQGERDALAVLYAPYTEEAAPEVKRKTPNFACLLVDCASVHNFEQGEDGISPTF